jgi:hypothetical protein
VKSSDKEAILDKIKTQDWAKKYYQKFKERLNVELKNHQANPTEYLSKMPLDWSKKDGSIPPMIQLKSSGGTEAQKRQALMYYLQNGIDCGIIYYLTDDESYAQLALDVLYTMIEGISQITPSNKGHNGGGYIYSDDHLREAREIGASIPILYDFVHSFIAKGGKPFDVVKGTKTAYSFENGEKVFKTYIKLALEQGIINCNWPVLESSSLVCNSLALNNPKERANNLEYYLTKNTPNQDALLKVANFYTQNGGIWPESLGYANEVSKLSTYLMTLLTRYDAQLDLGNKYSHIPKALSMSYYLTFPNKKETVLFGDGHRAYHADYESFEIAYHLGKISKNEQLIKEFGALLKSNIHSKAYDRSVLDKRNYGAGVYRDPLHLLWDSPEIEGEVKDYPLPATDELPFAGIVLQRNFSPNNNEKDALMCVVAGGSHVHGHASGMNIELYGRGHVLGPKAGRGTYVTELHENYYRLFAGHNTVIVNGESQSEGGWAALGTNRVQKVAVEPAVSAPPISPNYSFSTTSFVDDKGDKAEASQERTLGIVRTSPTTGFYVDVFKSKSTLPNQFHDYIYRNLGEKLNLNATDASLSFDSDADRYMASASKPWLNNKYAKHPGWHYFKDAETSNAYSNNISATFTAEKLEKTPVKMKLFITGNDNREYTKVKSLVSTEAPKPYGGNEVPTLVIRQKGEAWSRPFAVVYEPFEGNENNGSVQSVENIIQDNQFKGLKIISKIEGKIITQYAFILESSDAVYEDKKLGISFKGHYAILTFNDKNNLQSIYVGEGKNLTYKKVRITSTNDKSGAAYLDFSKSKTLVNIDKNLEVKY